MNHFQHCRNLSTIILNLLIIVGLCECSNAKNYREAYGINISGQKYIKIFGDRNRMVHSPSDLFSKPYNDSILLPVPSFQTGVVYGKDIPVGKGHYSFLGTIKIEGKDLQIDLSIDDTGDKVIRKFGWNGEYILTIK